MQGTTPGPGRAARRRAERDLVGDSLATRLADRLPVTLTASRWSVPVTAMVALLAITGLVAVVVAVRTASAAPGVPVPVRSSPTPTVFASSAAPDQSVGSGATSGGGSSAPVAVGTTTPGAEVVVHVVGQVGRPGLVRLPPGARVDDAVAAAGGPTATADLGRLNLARPLVDGEQVVVPRPGEELVEPAPVATGSSPSPGDAPVASEAVNLNTATLSELDALPGIGPVLAQRVLDWRSLNGRFTSVDELGEVSGIGERVLERLRPMVHV